MGRCEISPASEQNATQNIYGKMAAEAYRQWYPSRDPEERRFYERFIEQAEGTALEIACGDGQLMIPYVLAGHDVEGVDASLAMLDMAREEARRRGVSIVVHHQKMEALDLGRQYALLYAPFGAVQHVDSPELLQVALNRFRQHTSPKGKLLLHLLEPHEKPLEIGWQLVNQGRRSADDALVATFGEAYYDIHKKTMTSHYRVQITKDGQLLEEGEWHECLFYYALDEIQAMVESAGYRVIRTYDEFGPRQQQKAHMVMIEADCLPHDSPGQ